MLWPNRCDRERHWLFRKSEVFRYAMKDSIADNQKNTHDLNDELVLHISEQCVAAGRLMQVAISQYEIVASGMQGSVFESRTLPAWTFISSAYSAIDALAAAVAAIMFGGVPPTEKIPGMGKFPGSFYKSVPKDHPIIKKIEELRNTAWYQLLRKARNGVLHHGCWPLKSWNFDLKNWHIVHSPFFYPLSMTATSKNLPPVHSSGQIIELQKIVEGFLWDLEKWEASIAGELAQSPWIRSTWAGPVIQVIRLKDLDHGVPEACFLEESDFPFG